MNPFCKGEVRARTSSFLDKTIDFPIEEEDFYKFSNFRSCLLEVYIQLDQKIVYKMP